LLWTAPLCQILMMMNYDGVTKDLDHQ